MNIYQRLSQEYKEFKIKERLIEAEKARKLNESSVKVEPITEAPNTNLNTELDDINSRLESIEDALKTAAPDEVKELETEKAELLNRLNDIEDKLRTECDNAESTDDKEVVTESSVSVTVDGEGNTDVAVTTDDATASVAVTEEPATEEVPVEAPVEDAPIEEPVPEEVPVEETPVDDEIKDSEEAPKTCVCKECGKECEGELCKECSKAVKETEDVPSEELTETEVTSYKVTRISPKSGAYMIEAQTKEGLTYITGKNWNETELTLDEAELTSDKAKATERFKSLLK